jgi:hypothetical protein
MIYLTAQSVQLVAEHPLSLKQSVALGREILIWNLRAKNPRPTAKGLLLKNNILI